MPKQTIKFSKVTAVIGSLLLLQLSLTPVAMAEEASTNLIPERNLIAQADAVAPSDVENLKVTAGDKKITLSWDTATDNVGVSGYKIYYGTNSVTNDGGSYTSGPIDAKNVISYDVNNLTNGTKYYFAVTAYDAAGNESVNYSLEVSAAPTNLATGGVNSGNDSIAPKVVKAESLGKNTVKITFSEGVVLPVNNPESAFSIKEDLTSVALTVQKAELDSTDISNKTVILSTAEQKVGKTYIITAGIDIKDKAGNPIVSGTSDTGSFIAKDTPVKPTEELKPAPETSTDKTAPAFVNVTALDSNTVEVTFSEPVVLKTDPRENFIVTEEQNIANVLGVKKVTQGATGMIVAITTDPQKALNYNLIAVDVLDQAGNKMSIENNATTFKGQAAPATSTSTNTDSTSTGNQSEVDQLKAIPEGAKDLVAKVMENLVVKLTWAKASENLADIANFVVYMSTDRGKTYGEGVALDPSTLTYDFSKLTPGMMYYFKLTTKDTQGKESQGLITSLMLPATGPELGLLLLGSLGAGNLLQRKNKKKIVGKK